jgi:uncharacterized protein (TIGR00255 family)
MTGFGRSTIEADGITIWAEVSSLNHRYLDIGLRLSPPLGGFENDVRKLVGTRLERGRVTISMTSEGHLPEANHLELNQELARQYIEQARRFAREANLADDLSATSVLRLGSLWALKAPSPEAMAGLWALARKALNEAIEQLLDMRRTEGAGIWQDLSDRIRQIESIREDIAKRAPGIVEEYRERLSQRIAALMPPAAELDSQRLLTEVALFAEKADISEELSRLDSHMQQFKALAREESNVGRRLDFLLQELFREITTIGSKARDAGISHDVVEVKGLLEKMREQVQNVE